MLKPKMNVQPRLTGIFTPSEASLRAALDIKYRRIAARPLEELFFADAHQLIRLQQDLGYEAISDGQLLWGDLLRPVYAGMRGIITGSMTRWHETNGFCFPPLIVGKPQAVSSAINDYLFKEDGTAKATQLTLPGPYTLLRMSQGAPLEDQQELLSVFTEQLQLITASLPPSLTLIEFSEPSIVHDTKTGALPENERRKLLEYTEEAYRQLSRSTRSKILLQLPRGDFSKFPEVLNFPVAGFGVDLMETANFGVNFSERYRFPSRINLQGKILSAGIVDAWSYLPEDWNYLAQKVVSAVSAWQPERVYVTSNSQLYQTISHRGALQKLTDIAELARRLS